MQKFPSIEQFRHVVRYVRDQASYHNTPLPVIPYIGTIKVHGTNGGIIQSNDDFAFLSRNRVLSLTSDNAGFCGYMTYHRDALSDIFDNIRTRHGVGPKCKYLGSGVARASKKVLRYPVCLKCL